MIPGAADRGERHAAGPGEHAALLDVHLLLDLEQMCADLRTLLELAACGGDRTPGDSTARGIVPVPIGEIDVSPYLTVIARVNAKDFGSNLRKHSLVSLAMIVHASIDNEFSIPGQTCAGRLQSRHQLDTPARIPHWPGAVSGLFVESGKAKPDQATVGLTALLPLAHRLHIDSLHRATHRFRIVAAVEELTRAGFIRHPLRLHEIA